MADAACPRGNERASQAVRRQPVSQTFGPRVGGQVIHDPQKWSGLPFEVTTHGTMNFGRLKTLRIDPQASREVEHLGLAQDVALPAIELMIAIRVASRAQPEHAAWIRGAEA